MPATPSTRLELERKRSAAEAGCRTPGKKPGVAAGSGVRCYPQASRYAPIPGSTRHDLIAAATWAQTPQEAPPMGLS